MTLIKLKIRSSDQGFQVLLTSDYRNFEAEGTLPALSSDLQTSLQEWQASYRQQEAVRGFDTRLTPVKVVHHSQAQLAADVKTNLNQWLNSSDSAWQPIRDSLIQLAVQLGEESRLLLDMKDISLRRLPWQEWSLLEKYYPHTDVALRAFRNPDEWKAYPYPTSRKVRILVVVGRSDGIKTEDDLQIIQQLEQLGAEVTSLIQPQREELQQALRDADGYHIFIFTGHSRSQEDGQIGWIEINNTDSLSVSDFKNAIKNTICKGLRLAIFNSCDGLGIASELAELQLSRCLVMREPVPDQVAIAFLRAFFQEFAQHQKPLSTAIQAAREQLEYFNNQFPGATWLPTLCMRSDADPLTWQKLLQSSVAEVVHSVQPQAPKQRKTLWIAAAIAIPMMAGLTWLLLPKSDSPTPPPTTEKCPQLPAVPQGATLRIRGSGSMVQITEGLKKGLLTCLTDVQVDSLARDSADGIADLLGGRADIAAISRPLSVHELNAGLQAEKVGVDTIAFVVKRENPFQGELSSAQIKGIFKGTITNWAQVGGVAAPLRFINVNPESVTHQVMRELVLDRDNFGTTPNIETLAAGIGLQLRVSKLAKDGITYYSYLNIKNQKTVRLIKVDGKAPSDPSYPYRRPLYYIYRDAKNPVVRAFLAYAKSPAGQKIVHAGE